MSELIAIIGGYLILGLVVAFFYTIVEIIPALYHRLIRNFRDDNQSHS